jgi:hypothetical protein
MSILTEKQYPKTEFTCIGFANEVKMKLATWVRVKRGETRYLVYVEDIAQAEVSATDALKSLAEFTNKFKDSFTDRCLLTKYYWQVPESIHEPPYVNKAGVAVVTFDKNHLSDKEEFMTKYKLI